MKAIDSNLLVYASLTGHPARAACAQHVAAHPDWVCNIANLVEMRHVLVSVYGLAEADADMKFADFRAALTVVRLTDVLVGAALLLRQAHGIDVNDGILLETCRLRGITTLATDDRRLANACHALGITPETPVGDDIRLVMSSWEEHNLPARGLPRILLRVHRWIDARDPLLAADFRAETQALSRLV